jgi:DNA polymerase IV
MIDGSYRRPACKFLAKIASDWRKSDGLFVIQPHEVQDFLLPLPVGCIPGVSKVTESRMKAVGIARIAPHPDFR